jgi:DNA anti-recombination protein RmuC
MSDRSEKLFELRKLVDEAQINSAESQGELNQLLKDLKTKWKCEDEKAADKKSQTMTDDLNKLNQQMDKFMEEIEEKYEL